MQVQLAERTEIARIRASLRNRPYARAVQRTVIRRRSGVVAFVVACAACSSSTAPPAPSGVTAPSAIAPTSPPAVRTVTLRLDLRAAPAPWREVLVVPFGPAANQIGITNCSDCEVTYPAGFAVAENGSFWILDNQKSR